ncbi:protein disulfide-isomerase precursor [Penicillium angulare]|uniref:Protein disulfide-isomerase n=1 Tax=Penicillium angulare TaxID=116970 RepID=A0A9W9FJM0_9EURO|nr:protein disulfide-isomerase precursor [Penicillium angulare]
MRSSIAYVLSLLGAASAASSTYTDTTNSNVVSLTESTFPEFLESHGLEAANILENVNVSLVKVDCTEETDLCYNEYDINAWPTLMLLNGPEPAEKIQGYRETDAVVSIVMDVLGSDEGETESYGQFHGQNPLKAEETE